MGGGEGRGRGTTSLKTYLSAMKVIYQFYRNGKNGFYRIRDSSNSSTKTYCQMTSLTGCSGGGWTLVMKTDGRKVCTRKETVILKQAYRYV